MRKVTESKPQQLRRKRFQSSKMDDGFFNFGYQLRGTLNVILKNFAADLLPSRDQGDSKQQRFDLLLHIHQLEKAIRLLHNLAHLDIIQVEDSFAFREVYQELNHQYAKVNLAKEKNMCVEKSKHPNVVRVALSAVGQFC